VLVANARKLRLIHQNKHKTDKIDAENLARLARVDPKLLAPLKHREKHTQAHLALYALARGFGRSPHAAGQPR
jgi:transposase